MLLSITMKSFLLKSGVTIRIREIPNLRIFQGIAKSNLILPLPPTYEMDDGRIVENPHHPLYHDALTLYEIQRANIAFEVLLQNAIEFDFAEMNRPSWSNRWKSMQKSKFMKVKDPEHFVFLKEFAISQDEKALITRNAILHEQEVYDIFKSIVVTRNGMDIHSVGLVNSVDINIAIDSIIIEGYQLVSPLDEAKACIAFGMNWIEWQTYSNTDKANVIALYRLEKTIEAHKDDIVQIESERKSKSKGKT